jgi:hypothetical protein
VSPGPALAHPAIERLNNVKNRCVKQFEGTHRLIKEDDLLVVV